MMKNYRKYAEPRGYKESSNSKVKIACSFDPELFEKVRALAERNNIPFSRQIERLISRTIEEN